VDTVFEHASIPATVMEFLLGPKRGTAAVDKAFDERSPREKAAATFLDLLSAPAMRADVDTPTFRL